MFDALIAFFQNLGPVQQALLAGMFTYALTALGASLVFFTKTVKRWFLDVMLGFSAGVMIAASFWSLLLPALEMGAESTLPEWLPAAIGFLLGGLFLRASDQFLPHLHLFDKRSEAEGLPTNWRRSSLLMFAMTLHNIPEGLAIGVAFGAAAIGLDLAGGATLAGAVVLALGIGIQNFPEGTAVSAPLRAEGMSRRKSFWYGQLSGVVEPFAAVLGAAAVLVIEPALPYALAFAAGAMIYVVVEELIPESQSGGNTDIATLGVMVGFTIMMVLDVSLG